MFKYTVVLLAVIACAAAKPGLVAPLAYSAPLVAAPGVVTATSSQVIARNFNGIATAPVFAAAPIAKYVTAPVATPLTASYVGTPLAYSASLTAPLAYSAPLAASPFAYSAPFGYASAYGYASPLTYRTSSQLVL